MNDSFNIRKARNHHAIQVNLVKKVVDLIKNPTIIDVGDSAGTHSQYFLKLFKNQNIRMISVNLDPEAIRKIRAKGLKAIHCRAEELD